MAAGLSKTVLQMKLEQKINSASELTGIILVLLLFKRACSEMKNGVLGTSNQRFIKLNDRMAIAFLDSGSK